MHVQGLSSGSMHAVVVKWGTAVLLLTFCPWKRLHTFKPACTIELAWMLMSHCFNANNWYFKPQQQAAYWCIFSGPEEQLCRRLKPPIYPPGILIIWLDSEAKELHCLTPFKQRHCTERVWLCYSLQCQSNKRICVLLPVCVCCILRALSVQCCFWCYYMDVWLSVCGIVHLHPSSVRLRFPKQGVFSGGDNNATSHWNAAGQTQPKRDPVFQQFCQQRSLWSQTAAGKKKLLKRVCVCMLRFGSFHSWMDNRALGLSLKNVHNSWYSHQNMWWL